MRLAVLNKQKFSSIMTVCLVVVVVLVCMRLGFWQIQRAEQKQQQLNAIEKIQQQGVMSWEQLQQLPKEWNKTGVLVSLNGYFDTNNYWLLDNQIYNGQVGYDLLVLLKLSDESRFLLVNLGWVKAERSREILPNVTIPSGKFTLTAQIKEDNLSGFTLANNNTQSDLAKRIQIIDLQALSSQSNRPLVNFMAYRQGQADEIAAPHYQAVVMSPEKHYAYSVQWFLIAVACVVVAIFASRKRIDNEK
mgnify:CR=1 FL=1